MQKFGCLLAILLAWPALAHADSNDLVLSSLGDVVGNAVAPNNQEFRSLASELGIVLAPKFLSPSDTLGYSGFQFSLDTSFTTINNGSSYWRATEEGSQKPTSVLPTVGFFARKGIWLPLPSFEVGAGALHVVNSRMWAGQVFAKFGIHEGFHDLPIPSVAARGSASRLFGSEQIDLTVASFDISVSKSFGVAGTINLAPYAGWNLVWIIPRSEVIDKTPEIDAFLDPADLGMNFVFPDQDTITRQRFFGGVKVKYYVFTFVAEVNVALRGTSVDDDEASNMPCTNTLVTNCDAQDQAGLQQTYSFSVALDF